MNRLVVALLIAGQSALAQKLPPVAQPLKVDPAATVPKLESIVVRNESDLAPIVERYSADQQSINRRYDAGDSPEQRKRLRAFATTWRQRLAELDFGKLNAEGKADYVLLDNHLKHQIAELDRTDRKRTETAPLLPFADIAVRPDAPAVPAVATAPASSA